MKKKYIFIISVLMTGLINGQIFITELADPSDDTGCRYIELYNSSTSSVDLSANGGYKIQRYVNDDTTPDISVMLTGTINAESFYTIGLAEFNTCYGFTPNMVVEASASLFSNGDDKLLLIDNTDSAIDLFGNIGVEGVDTCDDFRDGRAERKADVTFGNSGSWMESNWNMTGIGNPTGCTSYTTGPIATTDNVFDPGAWIGAPVPTNTLLSFVNSTANVSEDVGSVEVCVAITNPDANNATTVELSLDGSSSTSNGNDYSSISFPVTVTFPAGSADNQCITVNIIDDSDIETNETMIVNLQNVSGGNAAESGNTPTFTLTIQASDSDVNPGDIVITEIFQNPKTVSDGDGEWFEIFNKTNSAIDIDGWVLDDHNSTSTISNTRGTTIVPANGYLVLVKNINSSENGNIPNADYNFGDTDILLANSNGQIVLKTQGIEIDRVAWLGDGSDGFPVPDGASMELATDKFDSVENDTGSNWALATASYGDGDFGTPGTLNDFALSVVKNEIEGFTMYPNPVNKGFFSINTNLNTNKNISLFDVLGKEVLKKSVKNKEQIDVLGLKSGIYILRVQENDRIATRKLIIK